MNVTELRERLEALERQGFGKRSVEVIPAPPPLDNWPRIPAEEKKRCQLNFVVMNYVVESVSLSPLLDQPAVSLIFVEAGEMPAAPELAEDEALGLVL